MEHRFERMRCQAEIHHPLCNGWANSIDHFTPRCIIRLLGRKANDYGDDNLVPMNNYCHVLKDTSTPPRKWLLARLLRGKEVTLDDYRRFRNRYDLVFADEE